MNYRVAPMVLHLLTLCWLVVEAGQFLETRLPWGQQPLFWPLWICIALVIALLLLLIDEKFGRQRP